MMRDHNKISTKVRKYESTSEVLSYEGTSTRRARDYNYNVQRCYGNLFIRTRVVHVHVLYFREYNAVHVLPY